MKVEEFKLTDAKSIVLEEKEGLITLFKIRSYQQKLKWIEKKKFPQKNIKEVVQLLFSKQNRFLNSKTKNSISKIIYSPNERIIVLITKNGKEIIWNRDQLIKMYGWFFFVSETEKGFKEKKETKRVQKLKKEEKIVSITKFQFDTIIITIKQKENMRGLYKTKEYFKYLNIINKKKIPQKPINDVLIDFFKKNENIPIKEKKSIIKVIYYQNEKVIVIKSLIGDKMYENLDKLVEQNGWYFYITGVPVGKSEVSIAIDKIEKRFNSNYFKQLSLIEDETNPDKIRVALYAIALKPNHNCFILNIGKINILLDSGVSEEYFEHIKDYLNNFNNYLQIAEKEKLLSSPNQTEHETSNEIKSLKELEDSFKKVELNTDLNNLKDNKDTIIQKNDEPSNFTSSIEKNIFKPKIDAIFVSHSHFDHVSGLKELIKIYPDIPILSSRITMDLYILRDSDFVKQENHDSIQDGEYQNIIKNVIYVENGEKIEFKEKDSYLAFYHAGHMPGALMMLIKVKDFRFLYTGDYTYYDIAPFAGTGRFLDQISRPIDFLLIDASSADENFGNISNQFHSLILFLEQKAEYGDNCLIGADPSSLAISFMLIFWRYFRKLQLKEGFQKRPNIYVDQMIRKNIQVINHRYEYIYGPISKLIREKANPFNSIKFRWFDIDDLEFLRNKNNIIISHPPDLSYGIIKNIINVVGRNPHNLVFLSGAIHEEPGLSLITPSVNVNEPEMKEIVFSDTWKVPFRALLINSFAPQIKIKLHGDQPQLFEMIKNLQPKRILFFHQSPRALVDIAKKVEASFDFIKRIAVPYKRRIMILN